MSNAALAPTDAFRTFYARTLELQRRIEQAGPTDSDAPSVDDVQSELRSILDRLEEGDKAVAESSQLAMAVFADQHFTHFDWPGAADWRQQTLEFQLFQTESARDGVYERIAKLLEVGDPGRRELGRVYLLASTLGLSADLPSETARERVQGYEKSLLEFTAAASANGDSRQQVTPGAYEHTAARPPSRRLPPVRRWGWLAFGSLLLLLATSYLVWLDATADLAGTVDRLLTAWGSST